MPVLLMECSMFFATCWLGLLTICPMLCSSSTTLFNTCLLIYAPGFLSMLLSISANGSDDMLHCLYDWCFMYTSVVTAVGFMCHLFDVMHLPFVVSWIVYDLLWWLWSPLSTTVPWVHSLPSFHWTTTADLLGYKKTLVGHYCHFCVACPWACSNGHHHGPAW